MNRAAFITAVGLAFALNAAPAAAQQVRTFVSGAGSDTGICGATSPCRHFAYALTQTAPGGEIVAADSAGYGPVTINSSLSISGALPASITVPAGTAGITINAGAGTVILSNLEITGGGPSTTGISLGSGHLILLNSTLKLLATGLNVQNTKADVSNTNIIANTTGVSTTGTGVDPQVFPFVGPTQVRIAGGNIVGNTTAFLMNDPGSAPSPATYNKVTIFLQGITSGIPFANIAGNATVTTGTGPSCAGMSNCTNAGIYTSATNYNMP